MAYEKKFKKPYPNGWKNSPFKETPITAEILNGYDAALEHIETWLSESVQSGAFAWAKTLTITFDSTPGAEHTLQIMTQEGNIALDYANGSFRSRGGTTLSTDSFSFSLSGNVLTIIFSSNWACGFIMSSKPFTLSASSS